MKKVNQRAKKGKRAKKNNVAPSVQKEQKKVSTGTRQGKPLAKARPSNNRSKEGQDKKIARAKEGKRGVSYYFSKSVQFLRESRTELKKVKWPNRRELLASTAVVIFLVLVVALFLGVVDFGLIKMIKNIVG